MTIFPLVIILVIKDFAASYNLKFKKHTHTHTFKSRKRSSQRISGHEKKLFLCISKQINIFLQFNEVKTKFLSQYSQFPLGACFSQSTSHIFSYIAEKLLLRICSNPWDCVPPMTQFDENNFHSQSGNESIGQLNEHVIELFQQYRLISSKNL